jgi:dTDP-4-amino-4,6-dideoxygalactose transaminase
MDTPRIPFLKPHLVELPAYEALIREIERSHIYSNFGPVNTRFEAELLARFFTGHGALSTVNNATIGLMAALKLHGRPDRRHVIMPSWTFAATPLAAMWAGFTPYFVDIDPDAWVMDPTAVTAAIAALDGDVAAVMPYATFGNNLDLAFYAELERQGLPVVVDAASSLGCFDGNANFGAGFPGLVVYSLHATKSFPIGEGGLIYSADAALIARIRSMLNFGFDKDRASSLPGLNGKLPELLAGIGIATLQAFDASAAKRNAVAHHYETAFATPAMRRQGWQVQRLRGDVVRQFFPVLTPPGKPAAAVTRHLEAHGIQTRQYFNPTCHQQPAFAGFPRDALANTEALTARSLSLPLWNDLPLEDVDRIVELLATA